MDQADKPILQFGKGSLSVTHDDGFAAAVDTHVYEDKMAVARERTASESTSRPSVGLSGDLYGCSEQDPLFAGIGESVMALKRVARQIAPLPVDVVLMGETGVGKDQFAKYLHAISGRKGPFVAINCAGIPEALFEGELFGSEAGAFTGAARVRIGKLEYADGGTVFLDEIESMPLNLQAKLLRVLQERQIERLGGNRPIKSNFRVITATKTHLGSLAASGAFRLDLYYRLNVVEFVIPPLRERLVEVLPLFDLFVRQAAEFYAKPVPETAYCPFFAASLLSHPWPGNIRELKSCAQRAVLGLKVLPDIKQASTLFSLRDAVQDFERATIMTALRYACGSIQQASAALNLPAQTLYYRIRKLGITVGGQAELEPGAEGNLPDTH
ncbi:MAG: sigma-54 dependent transcriptional regulator [Pseudomonadota bacterium]